MVKVVKGVYAGAEGTITRTTAKRVTLRLAKTFSTCNGDDCDCWDCEELYSGDTITVDKNSVLEGADAEKHLLDQKIKDSVMSLRGLLLKKKMLDDPVESEKEIKRLLDIVEVEV